MCRLWNAANYFLIVELVELFAENVQCLSFMDGLIHSLLAVGDGGILKEFSIEQDGSETAHERAGFLVTKRHRDA